MTDPVTSGELGYGAALAYGIIQGVTEFLPVSSSGHLKIAHRLGLGEMPEHLELPFDVLLHGATLIAICVAFRHDILAVFRQSTSFHRNALVAIVPTGLFGLFGSSVVTAVGSSYYAIAACYVFTALLLGFAHVRMEEGRGPSDEARLETVTLKQSAIVGGLQVFALFPGVSRSGSTIAAGLLAGMPPELAVSYSFLVGLPLIAAATAKDALDGGFAALIDAVGWGPIGLAFMASLVSGLLSIAALKLVIGKRRLDVFAIYCGLIAVACVALGLTA